MMVTLEDESQPKDPADSGTGPEADLSGIPGLDFQNAVPDGSLEGLAGIPGLDPPPSEESAAAGTPAPDLTSEESAPADAPAALSETAPVEPSADDLTAEPAPTAEPGPGPVAEAVSVSAAAPAPAPGPMDSVKALSENIQIAQAPVEAAYPFSLRIEGRLSAWEREKLIDLLTAENMGIREVDLEPQLEAGRILIPRISEYAGILLVQALRGTSAEISLGPSDQIFSSEETREDLSLPPAESAGRKVYVTPDDRATESHPAERIPVVMEPELPGHPVFAVVDLVSASAGLSIQSVEAEKSPAYQDALEALKRELRYRAHRKGANAVVNFTAKLESLRLSSQYRLTVMGSAIRF